MSLSVNENIGQKILSKGLENIVKKVASGKTLTSAERSLVEKAYGTRGDVKFAKTIIELSEILGVSHKTIVRLRKLKGSPKSCSDGRHNVAKWRDLFFHRANTNEVYFGSIHRSYKIKNQIITRQQSINI